MHTSPTTRWPLTIMLLMSLLLACNLTNSVTPAPASPTAPAAAAGGAPVISVLWPPSGSEFAVRQEVAVHVSASDTVGITRIELRSANAMLSSVPSPEQNGQREFQAILSWRPTRSGIQELEVVAYRHRTPSQPVPLTLLIRQRASDILATPIPFGMEAAAAPAQPGTFCQVRVDIGNLRYREGPGTNYTILGLLNLGETLYITGQNASGTWWQANRGGQTVWVSSDRNYSTELTSCAAAPIVEPR